jgi:glycogen(starch) synthase
LSREKGLHLLLDALPIVLRQVGHLSVTGIAAQGPAGYRRQILAMIRHLGLEDVVTLHPAVQRTQLRAAYAEHDLLFFHSANTDPVALVLMEAFAAGLPVVSSQASPQAHLVQEGSTCLCYRSGDKRSLARAIIRLFTDFDLQTELTKKAGQCVQARFSLQAMGGEFDALLRSLL